MNEAGAGIKLSHAYYDDVVRPLLARQFPGLPHAAGRLGAGSDVLGLDDDTSKDHDWGLRLSLTVGEGAVDSIDAALERHLPAVFQGHPTRFPFTGQEVPVHHVEVSSARGFLMSRLGFDPRDGPTATDWLSVSGQAVLEVIAGPVFADSSGELTAARQALQWYPDDVWRYVLACGWLRIGEEMPLMGRAADVGDELGSRILAARLARAVMHQAFLLERSWAPFPKWFGTLFRRLPCSSTVGPALEMGLSGAEWRAREQGLVDALQALLDRQRGLRLSAAAQATVPFWDRPYRHVDVAVADELLAAIDDSALKSLPRGGGAVDQRTGDVSLLTDPAARRRLVGAY